MCDPNPNKWAAICCLLVALLPSIACQGDWSYRVWVARPLSALAALPRWDASYVVCSTTITLYLSLRADADVWLQSLTSVPDVPLLTQADQVMYALKP